MRDHPLVFTAYRFQEGYLFDPNAPWAQICLRYSAEGSSTREDTMIIPSSSSPFAPEDSPVTRIGCGLELPVGSGELKLDSADPDVQPQINYHYLEDPWDLQRMREGVRMAVNLAGHDVYKDIIDERVSPTDSDLDELQALVALFGLQPDQPSADSIDPVAAE